VENNNYWSNKGCNPRIIHEVIINQSNYSSLNEAIIYNGNSQDIQNGNYGKDFLSSPLLFGVIIVHQELIPGVFETK
jgi:hypothetical protein